MLLCGLDADKVRLKSGKEAGSESVSPRERRQKNASRLKMLYCAIFVIRTRDYGRIFVVLRLLSSLMIL